MDLNGDITASALQELLEVLQAGDDETTELVNRLKELVVTDSLTGLFNRRFLDEFACRFAEFAEKGLRVSVAMLDLDDMKDINDQYGHLAGDAVLRDVAHFLKQSAEVYGDGIERHAVRYGGDEFLVIDAGSDPRAFERDVRERYAALRRACKFGDVEIPFSVSIGVATSDEFGWDWDALLDAADQRMYAGKRARDRKITLPVE